MSCKKFRSRVYLNTLLSKGLIMKKLLKLFLWQGIALGRCLGSGKLRVNRSVDMIYIKEFMKINKIKKHILKTVAVLLIQAFLLLDLAAAGQVQRVVSTLSPSVRLNSETVQDYFIEAIPLNKEAALKILHSEEYRNSLQRYLAASDIRIKHTKNLETHQIFVKADRAMSQEKKKFDEFKKAWDVYKSCAKNTQERLEIIENFLFDERPFVQYVALVELSILDLKEGHIWRVERVLKKKLKKVAQTKFLKAADEDYKDEDQLNKIDIDTFGKHAVLAIIPQALSEIKNKSKWLKFLMLTSLSITLNLAKINVFLFEEQIHHELVQFILHPEIYIIKAGGQRMWRFFSRKRKQIVRSLSWRKKSEGLLAVDSNQRPERIITKSPVLTNALPIEVLLGQIPNCLKFKGIIPSLSVINAAI